MDQTAPEFTRTPAVAPLHGLPLVTSRFELPPDYYKAVELFDLAVTNYEDGEPAAAAPRFMQVASLVRTSGKTTYSDGFAKMRVAAYTNAARSFTAAGKKSAAVDALTAALKDDAENKAVIEKLIKDLK